MFQSHEECLAYLEQLRWGDQRICPYCGSTKASVYKKERRYRCNSCFTSYSVTVGTLFHKTHLDLRKWFRAITIVVNCEKRISVRQLAREIQVSRATAAYILERIATAEDVELQLLEKIAAYENKVID